MSLRFRLARLPLEVPLSEDGYPEFRYGFLSGVCAVLLHTGRPRPWAVAADVGDCRKDLKLKHKSSLTLTKIISSENQIFKPEMTILNIQH